MHNDSIFDRAEGLNLIDVFPKSLSLVSGPKTDGEDDMLANLLQYMTVPLKNHLTAPTHSFPHQPMR